jgi:hypothetical protein
MMGVPVVGLHHVSIYQGQKAGDKERPKRKEYRAPNVLLYYGESI